MSNPWFRTYTEMVDDEKLRLLAFEDRWHFVALLCCKGKGILDESGRSLARRKVAIKLGVDLATLDEIARRLAEVDLIDEKSLQPKAWTKRQFESDNSTERVRKYRQKKSPSPASDETEKMFHCVSSPFHEGEKNVSMKHAETEETEETAHNLLNNKAPCNVSSPFHDRFAAVSETPPEAEAEADTDTDTEKNKTTPLPPAVAPTDFPFGKSVESPAGGSAPPSADSDLLGEAPPVKPKKLNGHFFKSIQDLYHETLPELSKCLAATDARKRLAENLRDFKVGGIGLGDDLENWRGYFLTVRQDDFIMGRKPGKDGTPFKASFDYILRPDVFVRITERRSS